MRKFMTSLTAVATVTLAAVPALGLLQAAHAEDRTATVSLVGLNLSDPAHAAEFAARVDAQAEQVCGAKARDNPRRRLHHGRVQGRLPKQVAASCPRPSAQICGWPTAPPRSQVASR
jgi:UrcA family protein